MKLIERAKRRRAGVYLARTRKHAGRGRENGYVGQSNNVPIRIKQHFGQDSRHPEKPWADLDPVWHVLWLPWWLSWKWAQNPLEAIAIRLLLPRYNDKLNHGNPRRVPLSDQKRQRAIRDGLAFQVSARHPMPHLGYRLAGAALMLAAVALPVYALVIR